MVDSCYFGWLIRSILNTLCMDICTRNYLMMILVGGADAATCLIGGWLAALGLMGREVTLGHWPSYVWVTSHPARASVRVLSE